MSNDTDDNEVIIASPIDVAFRACRVAASMRVATQICRDHGSPDGSSANVPKAKHQACIDALHKAAAADNRPRAQAAATGDKSLTMADVEKQAWANWNGTKTA